MSCPHGANSTPSTCSQCMGVVARRVTVVDGAVLINGDTVAPGVGLDADGDPVITEPSSKFTQKHRKKGPHTPEERAKQRARVMKTAEGRKKYRAPYPGKPR